MCVRMNVCVLSESREGTGGMPFRRRLASNDEYTFVAEVRGSKQGGWCESPHEELSILESTSRLASHGTRRGCLAYGAFLARAPPPCALELSEGVVGRPSAAMKLAITRAGASVTRAGASAVPPVGCAEGVDERGGGSVQSVVLAGCVVQVHVIVRPNGRWRGVGGRGG